MAAVLVKCYRRLLAIYNNINIGRTKEIIASSLTMSPEEEEVTPLHCIDWYRTLLSLFRWFIHCCYYWWGVQSQYALLRSVVYPSLRRRGGKQQFQLELTILHQCHWGGMACWMMNQWWIIHSIFLGRRRKKASVCQVNNSSILGEEIIMFNPFFQTMTIQQQLKIKSHEWWMMYKHHHHHRSQKNPMSFVLIVMHCFRYK